MRSTPKRRTTTFAPAGMRLVFPATLYFGPLPIPVDAYYVHHPTLLLVLVTWSFMACLASRNGRRGLCRCPGHAGHVDCPMGHRASGGRCTRRHLLQRGPSSPLCPWCCTMAIWSISSPS